MGDAGPIAGVLKFLTFLSLTLSKGIFTSNLLSKMVGPILRLFEIGFFPKNGKYWAVPPSCIPCNYVFPPLVLFVKFNLIYHLILFF